MKILLFIKNLLKKSIVKIDRENFVNLKGNLRKTLLKVQGKNNRVEILGGAKLRKSSITIKGNNNIIFIDEGASLNRLDMLLSGDNQIFRVGKRTSSGKMHIVLEKGKIEIGNDCLISYGIEIRNTDSHLIFKDGVRINEPQDVIIEDNVWIGTRALILKGVIVGKGAIVGAASVVTKSVKEKTIVAGNPAKQIKEGIEWRNF